MKVDLTQIEKESFFDLMLEPSAIDWDEEDTFLINPVRLKCVICKEESQFDIKGKIETILRAFCSRCFEELNFEVDLSFKAIFVGRDKFPKDVELELKKEDLDVSIFESEELDLTEVVREQILLSLPTQILCKFDCKGLCGVCWVNLNKDVCRCKEERIDNRLAKLKEIYERRN
ncbi:MAG: DUF177 domain-containing protein [Pyrinomonadaceae bacterium]|nr:DUF177 domain-containing protein [Pyrinomonadaceae bacterium]MCX7639512.1 DUF177 domain-containing protein [Pyrinomonadaceae bacterium]MDW8304437.1 DUF177 domain-containing protein [Acidobacteriota bacterium]